MVNGVLCINMNPPFVSFTPSDTKSVLRRDCSVDEVLAIVREIGSIPPSQQFAPKDFIVLQPITLSFKALARFGLAAQGKKPTESVSKMISVKDGFCATVLDGDCYEDCRCFDLYQIERKVQQEQVS